MPDIDANPDSRVKIFYMVPYVCSIRVKWIVRTMIMNCHFEVVSFYLFFDIGKEFIIRCTDNHFNSGHSRIFKGLVNRLLCLHINHTNSVNINSCRFKLFDNCINLFLCAVHRHMKIFQGKIGDSDPLHHLDGLFDSELFECISGNPNAERVGCFTNRDRHVWNGI